MSTAANGRCPIPARTGCCANADLTPALIARAIVQRLTKIGVPEHIAQRMHERIAVLDAREAALKVAQSQPTGDRVPWFCSGCPHNTSTRVPGAAAPWPASAATT